MTRSVLAPLCSLVLPCSLLLLAVPDAQAQRGQQQRVPAARQSAPAPNTGGRAVQPGRTERSNPAGTNLPSYAEPSAPPAIGSPSGGADIPGQAQANDGPGMPSDPNQVPLGGAEWLAAAGAAYALNRLRKREGDGPDDEEDPS